MKKQIAIPAAVSSLRIAALPPFLYLFNMNETLFCFVLFVSVALTDLFDGYLARKLGATSRFGAYYDAVTDFVLVLGIFSFFYLKGIYPYWLLALIVASFAQFLLSSFITKKLFDPVGRYVGSALYIGVALTVLFPSQATYDFVQYAFLGFFAVSLASRVLTMRKQLNRHG